MERQYEEKRPGACQMRGCVGAGIGFLFVQGIEQLYNIRSQGSLLSNSVLSMVVFGLSSYVSFHLLEGKVRRRTWNLAVLSGFVFSLLLCAGHAMNYRDTIWLREVLWAAILVFPMSMLLWKGLFVYLWNRQLWANSGNLERRRFFCYWGILLAAWVPALLASWPGIYAYDSGIQLSEYMQGSISAHHPVLHTWILGGTMRLGLWLFHSSQAGALLYSLLQMILLSAMLAFAVYRLQGSGAPRWFCYASLVFYGLHPANSLMALAATKDALFGGVMVLFVLQLLDLSADPEAFLASKRKIIQLAGYILAALALRNNAFHALILLLPFLVPAFRRCWKRVILIFGGCLILHAGITGPGYRMVGIEPGDPREMCSVLMQTAARAYNLVYLDLTEEEKEGFYSVIAEEGLQAYQPHFADPVKAYFDGKGFVAEPKPFLRAWSSVGQRYTKLYVDAILSNTLGYWYPGAALPDSSGQVYLEYEANGGEGELSVQMEPKLPWLWKFYDKIGNQAVHQQYPVISFLFSIGTFVWILLAGFLIVWQQKKYWAMIPMLLLCLYLFTLLLGPVVKLRYIYPIITCLPVILYMAVMQKRRYSNKQN